MPVAPVTRAMFFTVILQPQRKCCQCLPRFVPVQNSALFGHRKSAVGAAGCCSGVQESLLLPARLGTLAALDLR